MTDLLWSVGLEPDGIIGHSTGEIACGYCDGGLTREQAMLLVFHRADAILNAKFPPGAMAAVGLTWEDAKKRLPNSLTAGNYGSLRMKQNILICFL